MRQSLFLAAAILASASLQAHADQLYTLTIFAPTLAPPPVFAGTYTFVEPTFLTVDTIIQAANLSSSSGAPIVSLEINPTAPDCAGSSGNTQLFASCAGVQFVSVGTVSASNYSSFTKPLTSDTTRYSGIEGLDISYFAPPPPPTTVTPEPSTLALLGTGLLGLLHRRIA